MSKDMIIGYKGIGIANSVIDINQDLPFSFNKDIKFMLNFPKNLTLKDLKEFISNITKIPLNNLYIFVYDNSNQDNFLRRNNYDIFYCDNKFDMKRFIDFKENVKSKYLSFILFAKDGQNILKLNLENKVDFEYYLKSNDEIAFVDKNLNKYNFDTTLKDKDMIVDKTDKVDKYFFDGKEDAYSLIFLKYLTYDSSFNKSEMDSKKYSSFPSFITSSVLLYNNNRKLSDIEERINIVEEYKTYLPSELRNSPHFNNCKITYYSEGSSISETEINYNFIELDKEQSLINNGLINHGVIIILCLTFEEPIVSTIDIYTNCPVESDNKVVNYTRSLLTNMKITNDFLLYTVYLGIYNCFRKLYLLDMKKFHFFSIGKGYFSKEIFIKLT